MAGCLEKKYQSMILGQNRLKQVRDGPLHSVTAVADSLEPFANLLPLVNFGNAGLIRRQWVEMFLKICANEIRESRKEGRRGHK